MLADVTAQADSYCQALSPEYGTSPTAPASSLDCTFARIDRRPSTTTLDCCPLVSSPLFPYCDYLLGEYSIRIYYSL